MRRRLFTALLILAFGTVFEGCTCCAYLNHIFNADRNYEEAGELEQAHLDSLPADSESVAQGAAAKKYDKVIEKGSRVLERFPDNERQTARAVFLIGESFRHKGEWAKAITKYDEFERYFPEHDSMPKVEYERAFCLYKNGDYDISRFALQSILDAGDKHPFYHDALNLLALLEEKGDFTEQAIAVLEKMLADTSGTPYMRGKAHLRLASLYFKMENYPKAREHYKVKEIAELNPRDRYSADLHAAECLAFENAYAEAAEEYKAMIDNKEYKEHLADLSVRRGELLLLATNWTEGEKLLHEVTEDYEKTEYSSRGYFDLGDFYQTEKRLYEEALAYYDSSFSAYPGSSWGRNARERRDALRRLLLLRKSDTLADTTENSKKKFFDTEFQIAELFLFKLSELDSSLVRLDKIIDASPDSSVVMRATYARAFIYDEFKRDPDKAEQLYKEIIAKYPNSDYAKQAQVNLGVKVTVKTREDDAHDKFLSAESLWIAASDVPLDSMGLVDSAYVKALAAYDSVYLAYPDTKAGVQALYMKAMIFSMDPSRLDSASAVLKLLRSNYGSTPWGRDADLRLQTRLSISDDDLNRLRKRVDQNTAYVDKLSKQYEESLEANDKKKDGKPDIKSSEDEVLENSYNSMYDFE
ncbi:MAG: tetratricopeptide repeat protein [Fibrobacteraceae bacterium]|nr:tetratricopeptide repeat protein [Fibrobacteraceae bacterium]